MGNSESNIAQQQTEPSNPPQQLETNQLVIAKIDSHFSSTEADHLKYLYHTAVTNQTANRALGCLFGSFIGDALGAHCEFSQSIDEALLNRVMAMPGGGAFSLKPGQVTDDSEMATHLLISLSSLNPLVPLATQTYPLLKKIALEYVKWLNSGPFDIGITCRKGLECIQNHATQLQSAKNEQLSILFPKIFQEILDKNKESESNGSLMRIAPMAVFLALLQEDPLLSKELITNQIKLLHPKPILQTAGFLWVNTLYQVINRKNDSAEAFKDIFQNIEKLEESRQATEWFKQAKKDAKMSGKTNIGWAKIAWSYGMNCLYKLGKTNQQTTFNDHYYKCVIQEVIKQAGDTDTNAAIVGGLVGALVGFTSLPRPYMNTMLNLKLTENTKKVTQNRPKIYQPFQVLMQSLRLFEACDDYKKKQNAKQ